MRILVVSSYPPRHCGIGAYAAAQVDALRSHGHEVIVLSPPDGAGDVRTPFTHGTSFRRAARIGGGFDRIVVHYEPGLYFTPRRPASHVASAASLLWLVLRRPSVEIVVHEANTPTSRLRPDYRLLGLAFARARLRFHTDADRRRLEREYRIRTTAELIPHTGSVTVHAVASRTGARARLGIEADGPIFVCAGFLHPDKGFDRAVRAFSASGSAGHLVVVGSVRRPSPETRAYVDDLRALCAATPRATFVERYVSDDDFDLWIAAADRFVLPYRGGWSSGALARAQRIGTPAFVAEVGGLAEQAGPTDVVFRSEDALARLFALPPQTDASASRAAIAPIDARRRGDESPSLAGRVFGVPIHDVSSEEEVRERLGAFLAGDRAARVFTPNPEILLRAREDASYADLLDTADLALPDGTGLALLLSFRARRRVRRRPGVEVAARLLEVASTTDAGVVFLGGADGVAARAADRWRTRLSGLRVDVVASGVPVGDGGDALPPERDAALTDELRRLEPRVLLVGLGAPKQERWIARHVDALPSVRVAMGVGGAFDMWAGRLRRAPAFLHRLGLEWLWRLALEPGRLPRIVRATIVFPLRAFPDRDR